MSLFQPPKPTGRRLILTALTPLWLVFFGIYYIQFANNEVGRQATFDITLGVAMIVGGIIHGWRVYLYIKGKYYLHVTLIYRIYLILGGIGLVIYFWDMGGFAPMIGGGLILYGVLMIYLSNLALKKLAMSAAAKPSDDGDSTPNS
jgi:hypothetical protein